MKNKTFGNVIKKNPIFLDEMSGIYNQKRFRNNGIEFYDQEDGVSARDINRPIRQMYEEEEVNYEILQTLSKVILGEKKTAIIPGIFEEFNLKGLNIGYYFDKKSEPFLRIPTGAFLLNLKDREINKTNKIQDLTPKFDSGELSDFTDDKFNKRDRKSIIVYSKPNVEIYERELAQHFNIDLNEQNNDISVNYVIENGEIKYTCNCTRTIYNYNDNEIEDRNFDITTYDKNGNPNKIFKNVFDLTNATLNEISSFVNKDGYYSLEETIPLFKIVNGKAKCITEENTNYFVAYLIDENKSKEVQHSLSGNFALIPESVYDSSYSAYIKLFKINLSAQKQDTKEVLINSKTSLLNKLDRSCLDIKDLNVTNNFISVNEEAWHRCNDNDISSMITSNN